MTDWDAYGGGKWSAEQGYAIEVCPYESGEYRDSWLRGWKAGKKPKRLRGSRDAVLRKGQPGAFVPAAARCRGCWQPALHVQAEMPDRIGCEGDWKRIGQCAVCRQVVAVSRDGGVPLMHRSVNAEDRLPLVAT